MAMAADPRPVVYGPRSCAKADGTPKVGFLTRREANQARRRHRRLDQHAYRCPSCGVFHLGKRLPQGVVA